MEDKTKAEAVSINQASAVVDFKGKVLFAVFALLILFSVGVTYYRIVIQKDYIISAQTDCDPEVQNCFIYECDPTVEECTGDPEKDIWYYKIVNRKAFNIPECHPDKEECEAFVCLEGEMDCEENFCTEETKEEEDVCSDPETYLAEHSEEEEVGECEENSCLSEEDLDAKEESE